MSRETSRSSTAAHDVAIVTTSITWVDHLALGIDDRNLAAMVPHHQRGHRSRRCVHGAARATGDMMSAAVFMIPLLHRLHDGRIPWPERTRSRFFRLVGSHRDWVPSKGCSCGRPLVRTSDAEDMSSRHTNRFDGMVGAPRTGARSSNASLPRCHPATLLNRAANCCCHDTDGSTAAVACRIRL
jgi:hypothetical protein